jgi:hypothetical protein
MNEKGYMQSKCKRRQKKGSWWMFLFSGCYVMSACLFDVGNSIVGVCGVLCVSNVQRWQGSQT